MNSAEELTRCGNDWNFAWQIPLNTSAIPLSLSLINITRDAIAATASAVGHNLTINGLSSSGFDVKETWTGGWSYMFYEKAVLGAPGVLESLDSVTYHPYQAQVWIPYAHADGRNSSFLFPNERPLKVATLSFNSTVGYAHNSNITCAWPGN